MAQGATEPLAELGVQQAAAGEPEPQQASPPEAARPADADPPQPPAPPPVAVESRGPAAALPAPGLADDAPDVVAATDLPETTSGDPGRPGQLAVPSAEAFAVFGLVADAWRRGRFTPELFGAMEQRSTQRRATTDTSGVELLEKWIDGGKALIAGDHERASAVAGEFLALEKPPEWVTLLPLRFLARHPGPPPDWQVALFWGDPRNEARALVETAIRAAPNDRNLALARAVIDHLDGRHVEAARQAVALEAQLRPGRPRQVVTRFAGDQLLWSGDFDGAISWYKRLLMNPDRTEIGAVLRTLGQEGGPQMVARACAGGFAPACEAGRSPGGSRARRARPQP
jgi:hypothetical protein